MKAAGRWNYNLDEAEDDVVLLLFYHEPNDYEWAEMGFRIKTKEGPRHWFTAGRGEINQNEIQPIAFARINFPRRRK